MAHNAYDADRRSAVSSFYGGRKSSFDMLNSDVGMHAGAPSGQAGAGSMYTSSQQRGAHADRDDASSFFAQPNSRPSQEMLNGNKSGYNRQSYFAVGREAPVKFGRDEEEAAFIGAGHGGAEQEQPAGWDVYADFNNAGPRYSTAFTKYDEGYQRLPPDNHPPPSVRSGKPEETQSVNSPVELVTVPALGAEWKKSELQMMSKKGRKELKEDNRWQNFRAWTRDQRGCCGKWGTRKQIAIGLFIICVIVAFVVAFTLPRVPGLAFASADPLKNGTAPPATIFSRIPANFSFASNLDLQVDTGSNFLPLKFSHMNARVFDLETDFLVGTGNLTGKTVPAKTLTEIFLPLNFTYVASNDSDATWNNWYNSCKSTLLYANGSRPGLNFRLEVTMDIAGLIGSHKATTQITNVNCPVELPENSV